MLAFMSDGERNDYLSQLVDVDIHALLDQLAEIRMNYYAVTRVGVVIGVGGIAAPILQNDGRAIASVGILVPSEMIGGESFSELCTTVRETALAISTLAGYTGNFE
jgi:DNA-binding IclR family transcriptional regulator